MVHPPARSPEMRHFCLVRHLGERHGLKGNTRHTCQPMDPCHDHGCRTATPRLQGQRHRTQHVATTRHVPSTSHGFVQRSPQKILGAGIADVMPCRGFVCMAGPLEFQLRRTDTPKPVCSWLKDHPTGQRDGRRNDRHAEVILVFSEQTNPARRQRHKRKEPHSSAGSMNPKDCNPCGHCENPQTCSEGDFPIEQAPRRHQRSIHGHAAQEGLQQP